MSQILIVLSAAFVSGIWSAGYYSGSLQLLYILTLIFTVMAIGYSFRSERRCVYWLALVFFFIGAIRLIHADRIAANDISLLVDHDLTFYGKIADIPQAVEVDEDHIKVKYILECQEVSGILNRKMPVTGKVVTTVRQGLNQPLGAYGDKVVIRGRVIALHGYNNPGAIDTVAALKRQGITARLLTNFNSIQFQSSPLEFTGQWKEWIHKWRTQVEGNMARVMPVGDAAVLTGMLFGGYSGIDKEVIGAFAKTGLIHILSVSGTHIALVAAVMMWLGKRLRLKYACIFLLAFSGILFYAVVAGFTPPVMRSVLMGLIALAGVGWNREKDAAAAMAFPALVMLAYQPQLLYDISFQLSFACTAGLIYFYNKTVAFFKILPPWAAQGIAVTLAAQLGVLPFLAWYFNTFSLSSFAANIVVVPLVEALVVLALAGVMLSAIFPAVAGLIMVICSLLIGLIVPLTSFFAALPLATVYLPVIPVIVGVIYYVVLAWLYGYLPCMPPVQVWQKWTGHCMLGLAAGIMAIILYRYYPEPVTVHFIDVGQGDATLVTTPHRYAVMIDTGGIAGNSQYDIGEQVVVPYLKHYGILQLDYLFLTHGHQDHAGGAAGILAHIPVRNIVISREQEHTGAVKAVFRSRNRGTIIPAYPGQSIHIDGVTISVVYAPDDVQSKQSNEFSTVLRINYGKHSFLITGDLEADGEAAIITRGQPIKSDVLKVGHHGARTSSTSQFLQQVLPRYAVISVGYYNRFGHPHAEVLRRLSAVRAQVYRTDYHGAVRFITDGQNLQVDPFIR